MISCESLSIFICVSGMGMAPFDIFVVGHGELAFFSHGSFIVLGRKTFHFPNLTSIKSYFRVYSSDFRA